MNGDISIVSERKKAGFAVVGLGSIARESVLPAFVNCKKAKLVAFVGRDKENGLAWRGSSKRVLTTAPKITPAASRAPKWMRYTLRPPGEHAHLTVAAALAGRHALCEKPLAATVDQSTLMVETCRNSVLLMTAYRKYFEPSRPPQNEWFKAATKDESM